LSWAAVTSAIWMARRIRIGFAARSLLLSGRPSCVLFVRLRGLLRRRAELVPP
jgi:hypothetical protein